MKVLIPHDVGDGIASNPYLSDLINGLESAGCVVFTGSFRLSYPFEKYDIVNIHWPEYLIPSSIPKNEQISWLTKILDEITKYATIICTVHNYNSHLSDQSNIYEMIYSYASAFTHFGKTSKKYLLDNYKVIDRNANHTIIDHGNYNFFGPVLDKRLAKIKLDIPPNLKCVTVIGNLRNKDDFRSFLLAARSCQDMNISFVFSGSFTPLTRLHSLGSLFKRLSQELLGIYRKILVKCRCSQFIHFSNWLPKNQVAELLSASEIVFIPRPHSLNSGNVFLGLTYGCTLVGPASGNIGELLVRFNGFIYKYNSPRSNNVTPTLRDAIKSHPLNQINISSLEYSMMLDWSLVAQNYYQFFVNHVKH